MPAFERQQTPGKSGETVAARPNQAVSRSLRADNLLLEGQRALGNQGIQRLLLTGALQAKLRVGRHDDSYEQEAERVADTVMRMPEPEVRRQRTEEGEEEEEAIRTEPLAEGITPLIQRQTEAPPEEEEEEEPPQSGPAPGEVQPLVQRQEAESSMEEEEEPLGVQREVKGAGITHVRDAALVQRLRSPDGGVSLPGDVRSFFERRFGYDFSGVRIHEAHQDRADAGSLGARAFTYGKHIWLGEGESATDSRLMAHELTHVVQQNAGVGRASLTVSPASPRVQRQSSLTERAAEPAGGPSGPAGERTERADERAEPAEDGIRAKLAQWARRIPGYDLLAIVLGRDPISGERVERNAFNVIRGVLGLIPGGAAMFENLESSGAITRAFEWFNAEISRLNLTWVAIKELFQTAWEALSWRDLLDLSGAIDKVARVFAPTLARLRDFAVAAGWKVLEFIFEGVLSLAGGFGSRVLAILRRAGTLFFSIINNPIGFIGNLVAALRGGFERFSDNILDHLRTALMQWLFGALRGTGLTLPDRFDLKGVVSIVLQALGLTYDRLRVKLVGLIGEKNVARIEGAFDFLRTIVTGGLAAAWEQIVEYVENLQEMVIGGIRDWVAKSVVGAAIKKLVTLFNPAGAIIQAIMAIYNTVVFFIERAQEIAALADAVFDSISNIAVGNVGAAISYVERTMARALPVVIGFLARLIGLGNIGDRIKEIIKRVQAPVEWAITQLANFVVQRVQGMLAARREPSAPVGPDDRTEAQKLYDLNSAIGEAQQLLSRPGASAQMVDKALPAIHARYRLTSLNLIMDSGGLYHITGLINPRRDTTQQRLLSDEEQAELEEVAAAFAEQIKRHRLEAVFNDDPVEFVGGGRNLQTGDIAERVGRPTLERFANERRYTIWYNTDLELYDQRGDAVTTGRLYELDGLLIHGGSVAGVVSAKIDYDKALTAGDFRDIRRNLSFYYNPQFRHMTPRKSRAFGQGYRENAYGIRLVYNDRTRKMDVADFQSNYPLATTLEYVGLTGIPDPGSAARRPTLAQTTPIAGGGAITRLTIGTMTGLTRDQLIQLTVDAIRRRL